MKAMPSARSSASWRMRASSASVNGVSRASTVSYGKLCSPTGSTPRITTMWRAGSSTPWASSAAIVSTVTRMASSPTSCSSRDTLRIPVGLRWSRYSSNASSVYRLFSLRAKPWAALALRVSVNPMWIWS